MKRLLAICLLLTACQPAPSQPRSVRVAVIGGMVMTGLWQHIAEHFEKDTGCRVEVVATGPKEIIAPAFRKGGIDLITFHSSDEATGLVAEGFATNMRPWTWNEHVIVGPEDDPAGIGGMTDGAAALRRIAETRSRYVDAQGGGKRLVAEKLWHAAGIRPVGEWVIKDESQSSTDLLLFAKSRHAYAICGRVPVLWKKIPSSGMKILVEGDPEMRRPFVVMEAATSRFPKARYREARLLSDYLTGQKGQACLALFVPSEGGVQPVFYPLETR
jgi:tungstate transport system substrate-binding protein